MPAGVSADYYVRLEQGRDQRIESPQVGSLELNYEKLPIPDANRQTLCIYHAAPGSRSAQALALLATTIAGEREPVRSERT